MWLRGRPAAWKKKALEVDMRSAVIMLLFLFSILFLGAQAAQLDPPRPVDEAASKSAQRAGMGLMQPVGFNGAAE